MWIRFLWNIAGTVFLVIGLIGIPLPVLPTTPFLLLAAACYLRGSERMYRWMLTNRYFGAYLADYRAGMGIPKRTKAYAITVLWVAIGVSWFFLRENIPVVAILVVVAGAVSVHILSIRTKVDVGLIEFTVEDLPLVADWVGRDHVRRWWGDPERSLAELKSQKKRAIIAAGNVKVGLVVWAHPPRGELDEAGLHDVSEEVIDIDIMIGEPDALGRGVGTRAIRLVADRIFRQNDVAHIIAATSTANTASIRAFEKAGFRSEREFDDPQCGRCLLMIREREL